MSSLINVAQPNGYPTTPQRQRSADLNALITSIAQEFNLPIWPREVGSPSRRDSSANDQCNSLIAALFWMNSNGLHCVRETFRTDIREGSVFGDPLEYFMDLLRAEVYLAKHQPVQKRLFPHVTPEQLKEQMNAVATALKASRNKYSPPKQGRIDQHFKSVHSSTRVGALTKTDEHVPAMLSTSLESETFVEPKLPGRITKKRSLTESPPSPSKQVRRNEHEQAPLIARADSGPSVPKLAISFLESVSTTLSARTSFSSVRENTSFASTTATSFSSEIRQPMTSFDKVYGDINASQVEGMEELIRSFDAPPQPALCGVLNNGDEISLSQKTVEDAEAGAEIDAQLLEELDVTLTSDARHLKSGLGKSVTRSGKSEHRLVHSLPNQGLFHTLEPHALMSLPFYLRWECSRLADTLDIDLESLIEGVEDEATLYTKLVDMDRRFDRTSLSVWSALKTLHETAPITYRGTLSYTAGKASDKTLFTLRLHPLNCDQTSRLQRAFGPSRFLYLDVPSVFAAGTREYLKGQIEPLRQRFHGWLRKEHVFLGCTWRAFHIQQSEQKSSQKKTGDGDTQRVIMFALSGPNLPPVTIQEVFDWAIPLKANRKQGFCKAFARLDLSLSQTTPTICFTPNQVLFVKDKKANGVPECSTFDDPSLDFAYPYNSEDPAVMNDGCSVMSVGAAKEVCRILGITGMRPVSFQARINGCKGIWTISAPWDSSDSRHQAIWIEITESQQKIIPSAIDFDKRVCSADRWTLESVKFSAPPKPSSLYMDFMPVLEDRHVPRHVLCSVIQSQLDMDFTKLLETLDCPKQFRRWIHSQMSGFEENNRSTTIQSVAGLPADSFEKAILLLESGFHPTKSKYLSKCILDLMKLWLVQMKEKLKIRLGKSTTVFGIADPTGCLQPGEMHMAFSKTFSDDKSGEAWSHLKGEVLVARHPTLRQSDIQKVRAVYKEELSHLTDVVVFPSQGRFPLAGKLQGGDYDGDTFWLCWDARLTEPFLNAMPPIKLPEPETFEINVDKRKLSDMLGSDGSVDEWLAKSFEFKMQPSLLGQVTRYHSRLSYKENSISSPSVNALADLHDLIIDSAKNGYTFTSEAFRAYTKDILGIKRAPSKPIHETWMTSETDNTTNNIENHNAKAPQNDHIIDHILLQIVSPRISQLHENLQHHLSSAVTSDTDLSALYTSRLTQHSADPLLISVLQTLLTSFTPLTTTWAHSFNPSTKRDFSRYTRIANDLYPKYLSIQPSRNDHPVIQEWLSQRAPGEPTTWELLKASALFTKFHERKLKFVFLMAGRELCWLKALSGEGRVLRGEMWAIYKPRKEKVGGKGVMGVRAEQVEQAEAWEAEEDLPGEYF